MSILAGINAGGRRRIAQNGDPYYDKVVLLAGFDGAEGNQTFRDASKYNRVLTAYGNVKNTAAQAAFGTASGFWDGTGDAIKISTDTTLDTGAQDFTFECKVRFTDLTASRAIFSKRLGADTTAGEWQVLYDFANTKLSIGFNTTGTTFTAALSTVAVVANQWYSICVERFGTTARLYVDGVIAASVALSTTPLIAGGPLQLGSTGDNYAACMFGYIDEVRYTIGQARYQGVAYSPSSLLFQRQGAVVDDPYYDNVGFLLKFDEAAATTVAVDSGPANRTITRVGSGVINDLFGMFGTNSWYQAANTYSLRLPSDSSLQAPSISPWTFEARVRPSTFGTNMVIFDTNSPLGTDGWYIYIDTAGKINVWNSLTTSANVGVSSAGISLNVWTAIAVTWDGTTLRFFINGTLSGTSTPSAFYNAWGTYVWVLGSNAGSIGYVGYADEVRWTPNVCRYAASYTIATGVLAKTKVIDSYYGNVILEVRGFGAAASKAVPDSSYYARLATVVGDTQVDATNPKYGNGSLYFDGAGDYVTFPANTDFDFGAGDFTVEAWVFKPSLRADYEGIVCHDDIAGTRGWLLTKDYAGSSNKMAFAIYSGATGYQVTDPTVCPTGVWVHYAVCRNGPNLTMFRDGVVVNTIATLGTTSMNAVTKPLILGDLWSGSAAGTTQFLIGKLNDLRVTKGFARYNSKFAPGYTGSPPLDWVTPVNPDTPITYYDDMRLNFTTDVLDETDRFASAAFGAGGVVSGQMGFSAGFVRETPNMSALDMGAEDFTFEARFNVDTLPDTVTNAVVLQMGETSSSRTSASCAIWIGQPSPGVYQLFARQTRYNSSNVFMSKLMNGPTGITAGTQYAVALQRRGMDVELLFGTVAGGTLALVDTQTFSAGYTRWFADVPNAQKLTLGGATALPSDTTPASDQKLIGKIDGFRVSRGIARYTNGAAFQGGNYGPSWAATGVAATGVPGVMYAHQAGSHIVVMGRTIAPSGSSSIRFYDAASFALMGQYGVAGADSMGSASVGNTTVCVMDNGPTSLKFLRFDRSISVTTPQLVLDATGNCTDVCISGGFVWTAELDRVNKRDITTLAIVSTYMMAAQKLASSDDSYIYAVSGTVLSRIAISTGAINTWTASGSGTTDGLAYYNGKLFVARGVGTVYDALTGTALGQFSGVSGALSMGGATMSVFLPTQFALPGYLYHADRVSRMCTVAHATVRTTNVIALSSGRLLVETQPSTGSESRDFTIWTPTTAV